MDREGCVPHVEALRILIGIGHLLDTDSDVKLDKRSEDTLKVLQTFVNENEENIRNLADYLEYASKQKCESMDRLEPGRHHVGTHKVDSGIGTSDNRLSNFTNASTSSISSVEPDPTAHDRRQEEEHPTPSKDKIEDSNHSELTELNVKFSASSMSSVFGSEKEMSNAELNDTSGLNTDSGIAASDKKDNGIEYGEKASGDNSDVVREKCSDGNGCIFTIGSPCQSSSYIERGPDMSATENVPVHDGDLLYEARTTNEMNIPADAPNGKVLNIPSEKRSREELLSRSLSSASNNLALRHMLEARENSTSSESDNLPSSSSDGSICSSCGARRASQRPSIDLNPPLFY